MSLPSHHKAIGFRIQYWGVEEQSQLIYGSLLPVVRGLYEGGAITRVWYDRYNLRGPHISLIVGSEDAHKDKVKRVIESALARYVRHRPSTRLLSIAELNSLHRDSIKSPEMSGADVTFIPNNSIHSYDIPLVDCVYPFTLCPLAVLNELVAVWNSISLLSMKYLKRWQTSHVDALALRVMFLIDGIVFTTRQGALRYWLYHASTLLRPAAGTVLYSNVMAALSEIVSPELQRKSRVLESQIRAFKLPQAPNSGLHAGTLNIIEEFSPVIRALSDAIGHNNVFNQVLLREIVHVFLKQLGIATVRQIPLIALLIAADGRLCHTSED